MHNTTTISETADICTLINTFDVEPQNQQDIVDSLRRFTFEANRPARFFISASNPCKPQWRPRRQ